MLEEKFMTKRFNQQVYAKRLSKLSFWQSRSRWLKVRFEFNRKLYNFREFISDRQADAGILQALVRSSVLSFLSSVILLVVLLLLPIDKVKDIYIDNYDNLLIAVASITGIFLSLYFTGLNTVIGGMYAKSPKPVRELLIQERVNHFSVCFLVFLTLLCLELLAAGILFDNRPTLSVFVVAFLGCFAVLFFAELGKRAFYFFDPSLFASQLRFEVIKWATSSTPKGYEFKTPAFQDFYRKKSEQALDGFHGLVHLSKTETHLKETLDKIVTEIQKAYIRYLWIKSSIPTKSRWFPYSHKFQDWFTASEFLVRMASTTQTDLHPEEKPNHEWLEERIENLEIEALSYALDQKNWDATQVIFASIFNQFTTLGGTGEINRAFSFLEHIQSVLEKLLSEPIPIPVNWDDEFLKYKLGAIQVSNSLLVTLTAGLFNSLEKINLNELKKDISKQNWSKRSAPYDLGLPFRLLERTEYLREGLVFEKISEGKIVSPSWYITELIFQELAFYLEEVSRAIFIKGLTFFENRVKLYEKEKISVETNIVASDALEMEAKVRHLLYVARRLAENLDKERSIKGLRWAEWNWNKYEEQLNIFHDKMIITQVSHMGAVFAWKKPTNLPDYFGKTVVFAGEECIKSLDSNNPDIFSKLFEKYFGGILLTFEKMRTDNINLKPDQFMLLLAEPLMDLFHVSGYSLLYSEFYQNPSLFEPCRVTWENIIKRSRVDFLQLLALVVKYKSQSFGITNRDSSRTQWEMAFHERIRSLPRKYQDIGRLIGGMSVVDHPSELIQIIGGHDEFPISLYKSDDIFVDLCLSHLPEAKDLDFGLTHKVSESMTKRRTKRKKAEGKD